MNIIKNKYKKLIKILTPLLFYFSLFFLAAFSFCKKKHIPVPSRTTSKNIDTIRYTSYEDNINKRTKNTSNYLSKKYLKPDLVAIQDICDSDITDEPVKNIQPKSTNSLKKSNKSINNEKKLSKVAKPDADLLQNVLANNNLPRKSKSGILALRSNIDNLQEKKLPERTIQQESEEEFTESIVENVVGKVDDDLSENISTNNKLPPASKSKISERLSKTDNLLNKELSEEAIDYKSIKSILKSFKKELKDLQKEIKKSLDQLNAEANKQTNKIKKENKIIKLINECERILLLCNLMLDGTKPDLIQIKENQSIMNNNKKKYNKVKNEILSLNQL